MKNEFILSKNEYEVMSLFWEEKRPLSKAEIIKLSTNKSWKSSSVYILINSLLKKGAIKEEGFIKNNTNIGRTFTATLSESEYVVAQINTSRKKINLSLADLMVDLITEEKDSSDIKGLENKLKNIIKEKLDDLK